VNRPTLSATNEMFGKQKQGDGPLKKGRKRLYGIDGKGGEKKI
jgi:hypothetical protein